MLGILVWWSNSKKDNVDKKYYVRYSAVNTLARMRQRLEDLVIDLDAVSIVCIFAATFMLVAVLATASRGGILACIAAAAVILGFTLGSQSWLSTNFWTDHYRRLQYVDFADHARSR